MMSLKFSALDLVPVIGGVDDTIALNEAVKLAQAAERLGYSRYWVAEHHDMPGLACTSPEVLLAHIGAKTERIRIGSGALLLPHYKPLKVAESFNLLASLYPGRIDLGMGRAPGGSAQASMALSGNFLENVRQLPDSLKGITELMEGRFAYEGEPIIARPSPSLQPELWLLGTNSKSAAYAAEFGMGYVFGQFMSDADGVEIVHSYRKAFIPSRHCPYPKAIVTVGTVCAETAEEAAQLAASGNAPIQSDGATERKLIAANRKLFVGEANDVAASLEQLALQYGINEIMIVTMIPDYKKRLRSIELLAHALQSRSY
jgi:luciferase family oxidoreductase group 1